MAEEQKTVETAQEQVVAPVEVPSTDGAPIETKIDETAPAETTAVAEDKPVEAAEEPKEEAAAEEVKAEEVKPVEEGQLGYKAQGLSFPKNLIASKEFFFFGTEAVEPKSLASYQKSEKSAETAHHNMAWASETGKGLLFVGDKKSPTGIINLSDASEPEVDGTNKFHLTAKGNKHTFKAANAAERDNWVSQLKLKIAEAKELVATVTEGETFKATQESFKPAPIAKDEPKEEEAVKAEEAPKEEEAAKTEETPKEEAAKEEPKRRSASRKRASFFGFGKKEEKKEEIKEEEAAKTEETPAEEAVVAAEPTTTEAAPVVEVPAAATEDKATEEVESPKEKSAKRNSFFGGVFSKKEKKAAETKPTETAEPAEETTETVPVTEDAPELPPVETSSTPLDAAVVEPAAASTEPTEAAPVEVKKDTKEKRKSSLPFAFGKREKSPATAEDEEKPAKASAFSKFRATIRGRSGKPEDKVAEEAVKEEDAVKEEPVATEATPATETETAAAETTPAVETTAATEAENKPEAVGTTTPAVTAAA